MFREELISKEEQHHRAGVCLLLPLSKGPFKLAGAGPACWERQFGYSLSTMKHNCQHWVKKKPTLIPLQSSLTHADQPRRA